MSERARETIDPDWLGPEYGFAWRCGHCGSIDTHFAMDGSCRMCPNLEDVNILEEVSL